MKKRIAIIDLWRLIACLMIMGRHLVNHGIYGEPFFETWIYVEFFLILSGGLSFRCFVKDNNCSFENLCKNAVYCTFRKFIKLTPYVFLSASLFYLLNIQQGKRSISSMLELPRITFLLTSGSMGANWFLVALFMAYPCFYLLCHMKSQYFIYLVSFFVSVVYYESRDILNDRSIPYSIVRVFSGLLLGVISYGFSQILNERSFSPFYKVLLTVVEQGCLIFTVVCAYFNFDIWRFDLLCFVVAVSIILSEQSYTCHLNSSLISYGGKISMVMYLFHNCVGMCLSCLFETIPHSYFITMYYLCTFVISSIVHICVNPLVKKVKL